MSNLKVSRKNFLKFTGTSTAFLFLPSFFLSSCKNDAEPNRKADPKFSSDLEFESTAQESEVSILPGNKTKVWKYSGSVIKGRKNSLQILDDNYLGPIFHVNKGEKIRVIFKTR
ncbi:MAG: hypothetical protein U5K00_04215 [Melioribacteraceae bacterium]|nr:hypothetical protein [Melioribacteraceae bacterium]